MTRGRFAIVTTAGVALAAALLAVTPRVVDADLLSQLTLNLSFSVLALSLAFVWGYAGIFSFGQAAFFGLGGYAYAAAAINFGDSTPAIVVALAVPTVFAAVLGYFVFYARLSSLYVAVITLVVTLILYKLMGQTANRSFMIGEAMLGGYNGMPAVPPLNMPGNADRVAGPEEMFTIAGGTLVATYVGLQLLLRSRLGRIFVGMRENETRMALLGYDVRFFKLVAFMIAAAIAGAGGVLFTNWNSFIDPHVFALDFSAQPIIWVMIGGVGTLAGPIVGTFILSTLSLELGTQKAVDINFVLGAIFMLFVLAVPQGLIPSARRLVARRRSPARPDLPARPAVQGGADG